MSTQRQFSTFCQVLYIQTKDRTRTNPLLQCEAAEGFFVYEGEESVHQTYLSLSLPPFDPVDRGLLCFLVELFKGPAPVVRDDLQR